MKKHLLLLPMCLVGGYSLLSSKAQQPLKQRKGTSMELAKKTLPSGLSYEIIRPGSGQETTKQQSVVTVHYTGWLDSHGTPGAEFDSSIKRNRPFSFTLGVGQVIKGWDEGVMGMKKGEKRRLFIPSALGYGARGAGALIPPHADLIFDVELIEVA